MITHYTLYITHSLVTKNKLEKKTYDYLKSIEGTLVSAKDLSKLKFEILSQIEQYNRMCNRCKPIKAIWENEDRVYDRNNLCPRIPLYGVHFLSCYLIGGREKSL